MDIEAYGARAADGDAQGQLTFPFWFDEVKFGAFLTSWLTLETEEARLRQEKQELKEEYAEAFPMRAVLTAIKIVRAREGLSAHPKEPLAREHLDALCERVEAHYHRLEAEIVAITREALTVHGTLTPLGTITPQGEPPWTPA